jgi:hypothetical protein
VRVCFALLPTAHVFLARHRVAIAISGADAKHFAPEAGTPLRTLAVSWGGATPSQLALPLLRDSPETHRARGVTRAEDSEADAAPQAGEAS